MQFPDSSWKEGFTVLFFSLILGENPLFFLDFHDSKNLQNFPWFPWSVGTLMIKNVSTMDVKSGSQVLVQCEHFFLHSIIGPILLVSEWTDHKVCSHATFSSRRTTVITLINKTFTFSHYYIAFCPGKLRHYPFQIFICRFSDTVKLNWPIS